MKFVITAGHGDADPGAVANGHTEAQIVTELRNIVALKLRSYGHEVFTDGGGTVNKALSVALGLFGLAPIRLELHCNASENINARGVEAISLMGNKALAQSLSQSVAMVLQTTVRGDKGWIDQIKSARGKLAYVASGGIILETFFLTNAHELATFKARIWNVAESIAQALIKAKA